MTTLFENFSDAGQELVKSAQEHARSFGHNYLGTEHLLLAEIDAEQRQGHGPLLDRQVNKDDVAAYLLAKLGTMTTEADALRSIGIDPVALGGQGAPGPRSRPRDRRAYSNRPTSSSGCRSEHDPRGHPPRNAEALQGPQHGGRDALLEPVQPRHILLALLEEDGGLAVVVLDNLGIDLEGLQAELSGAA